MKTLSTGAGTGALFLLLLLSTEACQTPPTRANLNELAKVVEMSKGPCYARCPVYTLTIYENGIAAYEGERYTDKLGLHLKTLDRSTFQDLIAQFKKTNLWQYENIYRGRFPDQPTVTITYYEEGDFKTITGKDGRPQPLMNLEAELQDIANGQGWELRDKPRYGLPDNVIADEFIVQLNNGVEVYRWVRKFRENDLQVVEEIAPGRNYWVVTYDEESIDPNRMLTRLRADGDVIGVEFNKKGSVRN